MCVPFFGRVAERLNAPVLKMRPSAARLSSGPVSPSNIGRGSGELAGRISAQANLNWLSAEGAAGAKTGYSDDRRVGRAV